MRTALTSAFVVYYRVSTQRQGLSGLGLEAQRQAVLQYLHRDNSRIDAEFTEVETGKGKDALARRPQLQAALNLCKKTGARLLISKLDRLARNVHFISGLMESRVKFVALDMPEATDLTIHVMAAFAEHEAKRISERTKAALAVAKARGVKLGAAGAGNLKPKLEERKADADAFAQKVKPVFDGLLSQGLSRRAMLDQLNQIGLPAPRGGAWSLSQVQRTLERLGLTG